MAGLADGSVQGLVMVDLISEGTDIRVPRQAFMLRRTLSEPAVPADGQGRVLRPVYARGHDLETLRGTGLAAIEGWWEACGPAVRSRRGTAAARAPARSSRKRSLDGPGPTAQSRQRGRGAGLQLVSKKHALQ